MMTTAVVLQGPRRLSVERVALKPIEADHVVVQIEHSAISTGTERLLWTGEMPPFPGMGYPLVPGYESVGRVVESGTSSLKVGDRVFVPGSSCFAEVRGLFGGAAARLIVPAARVARIDDKLGEEAVLLALAATAYHALAAGDRKPAELIIGHGVLGRLLARIAVAMGGEPIVWEKNAARAAGAQGYRVVDPSDDTRKDYKTIYDVSGDSALLDTLIGRLARGGELVLAGFYSKIEIDFPPAFMREARIRVAAEWQPGDLREVLALVESGRLALDGLITHRMPFDRAPEAYSTAFTDPDCLKMIIDWSTCK